MLTIKWAILASVTAVGMVKNEAEVEVVLGDIKFWSMFSFRNGAEPRNPQSCPKEHITAESNNANT